MKIIQTKNNDYNSLLTFKTYLFEEKEHPIKDIEICFDIPFYKNKSIDFHCFTKDLTLPQEMRLMFMGVDEEQIKEIKQSEYVIVTCVHE